MSDIVKELLNQEVKHLKARIEELEHQRMKSFEDGIRRAMRPRPVPGATTTTLFTVRICSHCGYALTETGLCSDGCDLDAGLHDSPGDLILARYERTDTFLGDIGPGHRP